MVCRGEVREIDFEKVCFLIKELYKKGCRNIELTGGGEPTMYSRFEEFCRYASDVGYHLSLVTNGSKLGDLINIFEDVHFDWVRISIDAVDSRLYEQIHGIDGKMLDKILYSISQIVNKTDVGISYILSKKTNLDVFAAFEMAIKVGASYFEVKPLRGEKRKEDYLSDDEFRLIVERLVERTRDADVELISPFLSNKIGKECKEETSICWSSYLRTVLTPFGMYKCSYLRGVGDRMPVPNNIKEFIEFRNKLNDCRNRCYITDCSRQELNAEIEKYIRGLHEGIENEIGQGMEIKDGRWL